MGKGGYTGGSTIWYIKTSKNNSQAESDPFFNQKFCCKICGAYFYGSKYFDHLREHDLKGCMQCGEPYKPQGKRVHCCSNCGRKTILRLRKRGRTKTYNKKNPSKTKVIRTNKRQDTSPGTVKKTSMKSNATISSSAPKTRKNCRNKFSVSLGEILKEAIKKKRNSICNPPRK